MRPSTASNVAIAATEGAPVTSVLVATFTDADPAGTASDYSATINWGDGDTTPAHIVADGTVAGQFDVIATKSNAYAEEGVKPVTVQINDAGSATATAHSTATIYDAALTASNVAIAATEGAPVTSVLVATFTDADPAGTASDYSATINWGDGDTTASYSIVADGTVAGQFDVIATKSTAYAEEGVKPVTVQITDAGSATATAHSTATISDAALTASNVAIAATEGAPVTSVLVATFTDADPAGTASDYSATINWGDGDTTASYSIVADGTIAGQFDVIATKSNAYAEEGVKPVTVQITDAGSATTTAHSTATIADAALSASSTSFSTTEGAPSPASWSPPLLMPTRPVPPPIIPPPSTGVTATPGPTASSPMDPSSANSMWSQPRLTPMPRKAPSRSPW